MEQSSGSSSSGGQGALGCEPHAISPFAAFCEDATAAQQGGHCNPAAHGASPVRLTAAALAAATVAPSSSSPPPTGTSTAPAATVPSAPKHPHPHSSSQLPFSKLCGLFESILSAVNKAQQCARLEAFWRALPRDESFFPFMRLLMPHLDNARPNYQLRESKLARLYVEAMGLHERSGDVQRLLQWKDPAKSSVETTSFSDVVYVMLQRKGGFQRRDLRPPADPHASANAEGSDGAMAAFTVDGVNAFLDRLASAETNEQRKWLLIESLQRTTPLEQKWLVRIVLKDMKFRMTHQTLLAAFHPTALDKFNSTNDLAYVCEACLEEIQKPALGSSTAAIFLFLPLRPMLASPVTAKKLEQLLSTGTIVLEPKYDGERLMVHMDGERIMYWTRNGKNYTALYAPKFDATMRAGFVVGRRVGIPHVKNLNSAESIDDSNDAGHGRNRDAGGAIATGEQGSEARQPTAASSTSSRVAAAEQEVANLSSDLVTLDNVIFDGELLVYDNNTKGFIPFGMNRSFATSGEAFLAANTTADGMVIDGNQRWFCFMVFDVVFLNGKSLMHLPLSARRGILRRVIHEQKTKLEVVPSYKVKTTQEILAGLQNMVDANLEGVVLKASNSSYVPAERKNKWVKLKPDHIAGLSDTIDLVVVGGYYGTKFGARHISHFLMAAWDNASSATPASPDARFYTVCKIGNGFTSEELSSIQGALEPHWETTSSRGSVPAWLGAWRPVGSDLIPDVYVHPVHSVVLEVYGYAFVESANYHIGYTIRFPRMLRVRFDKGLADATDVRTLNKIRDASRDALLGRRALPQGAATASDDGTCADELLTVMSMKWKRRRDERLGALAAAGNRFHVGGGGGIDMGSLGDEEPQTEPSSSLTRPIAWTTASMPSTLRGGRVMQWAAAAASRGALMGTSLPPRTIAYVPRKLGVTRLSAQDAVLDNLFAGYEFCVLYTSEETCTVNPEVAGNRTTLERCLLQHGAAIVANSGKDTSLLLASAREAPKVVNWVDLCRSRPHYVQEKYAATDVVHCDWAMACVEAGEVLPLAPRHVLYASPSLEAKFKLLLDPFEDSYYEPTTREGLRYSLEQARRRRHGIHVDAETPHKVSGGVTAVASLIEATNRVFDLEEELGILPIDAMRVAAVDIQRHAELVTPPQVSTGERADTPHQGSNVAVNSSIADRILRGRESRKETDAALKAEPHPSAFAERTSSVKQEHCSGGMGDDEGEELGVIGGAHRCRKTCSPPHRCCAGREGPTTTSVHFSCCVPLLFPSDWTVSQFLTIVQMANDSHCHIAEANTDVAHVTHVVDKGGTVLTVVRD